MVSRTRNWLANTNECRIESLFNSSVAARQGKCATSFNFVEAGDWCAKNSIDIQYFKQKRPVAGMKYTRHAIEFIVGKAIAHLGQ